jgi:hypothetical protein
VDKNGSAARESAAAGRYSASFGMTFDSREVLSGAPARQIGAAGRDNDSADILFGFAVLFFAPPFSLFDPFDMLFNSGGRSFVLGLHPIDTADICFGPAGRPAGPADRMSAFKGTVSKSSGVSIDPNLFPNVGRESSSASQHVGRLFRLVAGASG